MRAVSTKDDFGKELHARATSKGCSPVRATQVGTKIYQGYLFQGKTLTYRLEGDELHLRVKPDSPQAALLAMVEHAIDPDLDVDQHEAKMVQDIRLNWSTEFLKWQKNKESDGGLLGIDDSSFFDSENLAQGCVNWLCS